MTAFPDLDVPDNMAARSRAAGHQVINPAELDLTSSECAACLRLDIIHLISCDGLATLPGWQRSKGTRLEVRIALVLGMTVVNAHDLVSMEIAG